MSVTSLHLVPTPSRESLECATAPRGEDGATTAEYATVTGCGVGFAGVLYKFLTSEYGQKFIEFIFNLIKNLVSF